MFSSVIITALGMAKTPKEMAKGDVPAIEMQTWIADKARAQGELEGFIRERHSLVEGPGDKFIQQAQDTLRILLQKEALKPDWSKMPNFIIGVVVAILTVFGTWIAWKALHQSAIPAQSVSPPPSVQSNSSSATPPTIGTNSLLRGTSNTP